jgi:LysR family transcriptional regulator, hydrogen peroxide-inducible genes activator
MMPNLRQLEYLVALSETRHFRRAAERSNTTQPTVSEQLKALETRLGVQLVERSKSKVLLTPLGEQVVEIARRMLSDANEIRALAASGGSELSGVLRLGLPPTIGPYLLPIVVPELQRVYPGLKLYVREELPSMLPGALQDGHFDLIMSLLPVKGAELIDEPIFREPLSLAVAHDHPLAARDRVRREDLANVDVLALGKGHQLHDAVLALCEEFGARLRFDYEGTSLDTLREMVAMGLGVTFLPGLYVKAAVARDQGVSIVELDGRTIYRTVGLIWRRTSARQQSYVSLARLLRLQIQKHFPEFAVLGQKD